MFSIFTIAEESERIKGLHSELSHEGFACSIASDKGELTRQVAEQAPDLVLVEINGHSGMGELTRRIKQERRLPIIAIVKREAVDSFDVHLDVDDFLIEPCEVRELILRIRRLLWRNGTDAGELIKCGDLVIDLAKCEVSVEGRVVMLTFKEYELLKFLV